MTNSLWAFFHKVRHHFLWVLSYLSILGGVFVKCHFCKVPLFSNGIKRVPFLSKTVSWHKLRYCYSVNMLQHCVGGRRQIYFCKEDHSRISTNFSRNCLGLSNLCEILLHHQNYFHYLSLILIQ